MNNHNRNETNNFGNSEHLQALDYLSPISFAKTLTNVINTSCDPLKDQPRVQFKLLGLDITDNNSIKSFMKELFNQTNTIAVVIL